MISSEETPLLDSTQQSSQAKRSKMNPWVSNTLSLFAVGVVGCIAWLAAFEMGFLDSSETDAPDTEQDSDKMLETVGIMLGYGSAVCYLWYAVHYFHGQSLLTREQCSYPTDHEELQREVM